MFWFSIPATGGTQTKQSSRRFTDVLVLIWMSIFISEKKNPIKKFLFVAAFQKFLLLLKKKI